MASFSFYHRELVVQLVIIEPIELYRKKSNARQSSETAFYLIHYLIYSEMSPIVNDYVPYQPTQASILRENPVTYS